MTERAAYVHVERLELDVPTAPVAKGRPRFSAWLGPEGTVRRRTHTPDRTASAERRVADAWLAAGRPGFADEADLAVVVELVVPRPASHYRADGSLGAAGRRAGPWPARGRFDVDNGAKLALDALNGLAWRDDRAVSALVVVRSWQAPSKLGPARGFAGYRVTAWDRRAFTTPIDEVAFRARSWSLPMRV